MFVLLRMSIMLSDSDDRTWSATWPPFWKLPAWRSAAFQKNCKSAILPVFGRCFDLLAFPLQMPPSPIRRFFRPSAIPAASSDTMTIKQLWITLEKSSQKVPNPCGVVCSQGSSPVSRKRFTFGFLLLPQCCHSFTMIFPARDPQRVEYTKARVNKPISALWSTHMKTHTHSDIGLLLTQFPSGKKGERTARRKSQVT